MKSKTELIETEIYESSMDLRGAINRFLDEITPGQFDAANLGSLEFEIRKFLDVVRKRDKIIDRISRKFFK